MNKETQIPLSPGRIEILKQHHLAFTNALRGKFDCTAVINGFDLRNDSSFNSKRRKIQPEVRYSVQMPKGLKISVWKDDLTTHKVDAVVNAANEQLSHGGGLALALVQAGGSIIEIESRSIIKHQKKVPTGETVVTSAGNLPCRKIIHAVGPHVSKSATKKELDDASVLIQSAIISILDQVKIYNLQSVAIPALSSGLFNFPLPRCADIIARTLKYYHDSLYDPRQTLEIRLVNHDDPSVQEMQKACQRILGPSGMPTSYSGAVKGSAQSYSSSSTSMQLHNVILHVRKGEIQEEKVDVIVNTISPSLDLSKGEISKAIVTMAGKKIQDEINKNKTRSSPGATFGEVIETHGCGLNCSSVYHTVCAARDDPYGRSIIRGVVLECLKKAAQRKYTSISFPAIGTGNLGFDKRDVAEIMTSTVKEFANVNTKQMDVNFVVYPKDTDMLKAFEQEIQKTQGSKGLPKSSQLPGTSGANSYERESPSHHYLEIIAPSEEAFREAKSWTLKILYPEQDKVTIQNNHIVYFDQDDHEELMTIQTLFNVNIKLFLEKGRGGIVITGSTKNTSSAALEVEAKLCKVQEEFARSEQEYLLNKLSMPSTFNEHVFHKKTVDNTAMQKNMFYTSGLSIVKVEKIENHVLSQLFKFTQTQVKALPKKLFQRVKCQFCEPICRVGFQREYAPPTEQKCGAGIYFANDVRKAMEMWDYDTDEEFIYIIVAQVLTGQETFGKTDMILPPPISTDPFNLYDSVTDYGGKVVIFNGHQALPEFVVTCKKTGLTMV